jgi:hypothetical protein
VHSGRRRRCEFADEYRAARDVELSRRLNPQLASYSQWLEDNAASIPIAPAVAGA